MSKKLYLDRDGTINKHIPYVGSIDRFFFHFEIFPICKYFAKKGFKIIIVTNQSGIERGFYSLNDFFKLSKFMMHEFEKHNINIEIRACPHLPEKNCFYRKPNIGMVCDERDPHDILIGDQDLDMITAKRANISNRWLISKTVFSTFATKIFPTHKDLLVDLKINF